MEEYIFPLPRNAFPREGTGVKTDLIFCKKVSLSAVVRKKREGRQCREVRQGSEVRHFF